ncbi:MAG: ABC transporter permease [Planctomycetota bacterium]|nr:ABC transporter permease [Planctomycetota bacterium]
MKPYLAVILDSFHAAAHSRILWVTMVLISIFLASIYPLSLDEVQSELIGTGLQLRYAGRDFGPIIQLPAETSAELRAIALAWFMDHVVDFIVGFFGIFVALVVSCGVIPETYRTGSVELLLSKPIHRPCLFMAKFVGGCIFVLLNISYLICGLFFIVGLRWGLWDVRILIAIPVFVFYFMLLFSISAMVGLFSRRAILSLFAALMFWGICILVGNAKLTMEKLLPKQVEADRASQVTDSESTDGADGRSGSEDDDRFWRSVYTYAIVPLHAVLPKPLELDDTVQYVLDRRKEKKIVDPWSPVISSGLFLAVILGICCTKSAWAEY